MGAGFSVFCEIPRALPLDIFGSVRPTFGPARRVNTHYALALDVGLREILQGSVNWQPKSRVKREITPSQEKRECRAPNAWIPGTGLGASVEEQRGDGYAAGVGKNKAE
ncbi:hypothetical protein V6N11_077056 [Hibiscus sabdariffa]|uniref:Uncharacterized protein n=1 Tax=Hibiscus sabdariffa TaxID=183260 RepID=A0ABR2TC15_9ROSI